MATDNDNGNGVHIENVVQLVLTCKTATGEVSVGGTPCTIALAQMIVEEAGRILAEKRRLATAQALGKQMSDAARTQEILDRVGRRQ